MNTQLKALETSIGSYLETESVAPLLSSAKKLPLLGRADRFLAEAMIADCVIEAGQSGFDGSVNALFAGGVDPNWRAFDGETIFHKVIGAPGIEPTVREAMATGAIDAGGDLFAATAKDRRDTPMARIMASDDLRMSLSENPEFAIIAAERQAFFAEISGLGMDEPFTPRANVPEGHRAIWDLVFNQGVPETDARRPGSELFGAVAATGMDVLDEMPTPKAVRIPPATTPELTP